MAGADVVVTQEQIERTLKSINVQARHHGLDLENDRIKAFIYHTATIQAQQHAETLLAWSIVHSEIEQSIVPEENI